VAERSDTEREPEIAADLVARIGRGVREAEDAMVRRYGPGLLYLLKRRTRDAELALDLRQDSSAWPSRSCAARRSTSPRTSRRICAP
jgi:hypothetical protein